LSEAQHK
jgi:serine-type D-Ala-D-Ala carboxypeptidase/endopeptidase